jgi:[ribosomal protein S5]-alanine N-acetyltransferase
MAVLLPCKAAVVEPDPERCFRLPAALPVGAGGCCSARQAALTHCVACAHRGGRCYGWNVADAIATPRLALVPLTTSLLRAVADDDLAEVERQLGARVEAGWEQGVPARLRLQQLAADASEQPWLVRAMVVSTPTRVVGSVGFHAPPDDHGRVEIGYDVVASERRKGYAREAARALLDWAWATGRARTCVASVAPHNQPSLALIRSFGFQHTGEHIDEIDGLELVFERRLPLTP